ncbi:MAG: hypothetical protein P4L50_29015 [Anaerolineaceae bacterium]|nr:hypothetical protein [Anaerolineaceae bacterium]
MFYTEMKRPGRLYAERFIRPHLAAVDERLTDPRVNCLSQARIAARALDQADDDTLTLCSLLEKIRVVSAMEKEGWFDKFFSLVTELDLVPKLIKYLTHPDPWVRNEAAWIHSNIGAGSAVGCDVLEKHDIMTKIIDCLRSTPEEETKLSCIWAVANFAGDSDKRRQAILNSTFPTVFVSMLREQGDKFSKKTINNCCWTIRNLFRKGELGTLPKELKLPLVKFALQHLATGDDEARTGLLIYLDGIVTKDIKMLSYTASTMDYSILPQLFDANKKSVFTSAIRLVGSLGTGIDQDVEPLVVHNVIEELLRLAAIPAMDKTQLKEIFWALSNIAAGPQRHKQRMIECGTVKTMKSLLDKCANDDIAREAAYVIANLVDSASQGQIKQVVLDGGMILLETMLASNEARTLVVVLEGLRVIFKACEGEKLEFERQGHLDRLEQLQLHANQHVYAAAISLLEECFSADEGSEAEEANANKQADVSSK